MSRNSQDDRFVERFEAAWRSRDPEQLGKILRPDVQLTQPLAPAMRGRAAAVRGLSTFIALLPDLEITIDRSMRAEDRVFISFRFVGTLGVRRVTLAMVDQIDLVGGLVKARTAFFDPTPLWSAALAQPWLWPRVLRSLLRARRSHSG